MKKYVLLINGDKGFSTSDGEKIYFPDRTSSLTKAGVVKDPSVTLDKGSYAFITGEMLSCEKIDLDLLSKCLLESFVPNGVKDVTLGNLSDDCQLAAVTDFCNDINILCQVNGEIVKIDSYEGTSYRFLTYRERFLRRVVESLHSQINCSYIIGKQALLGATKLSEVDKLCFACRGLRKAFVMDASTVSINCINNTWILVHSGYDTVVVYKDKDNNIVSDTTYTSWHAISDGNIASIKSNEKLSMNNVEDFALKNHICLATGTSPTAVDSICEVRVRAFCDTYSVLLFSASGVSEDVLNNKDLRKVVDDSVAELSANTKRVGKYCSKDTIRELRSLSLRNICLI